MIEYLIKDIRKSKNMTLRDLSRKTGISKSYLSEIERNEKTHYSIAEGEAIFCAVIIDIDEKTKDPVSINRIQIRPY